MRSALIGEFLEALRGGNRLTEAQVVRMRPLYGRIVRHFRVNGEYSVLDCLADYPKRCLKKLPENPPYAFFLGIDGLKEIIGRSLSEVCIDILCWKKDALFVQQVGLMKSDDLRTTLVLVDTSVDANLSPMLADADGLFTILKRDHPESATRFEKFIPEILEIQKLPIDEKFKQYQEYEVFWQDEWRRLWAGWSPSETPNADSKLMTFERFESIPAGEVTLVDCRRLLFDTLFCGQRYTFEGFTTNRIGGKISEYLCRNINLSSLQTSTKEILSMTQDEFDKILAKDYLD